MLGALAPHLLRSFNAVREIDDLERSIASLRKGHNAESSFWLVLGPTFYIVNGSVNAQACLTRSFRNHVLGLHPPVALIDRLKRISDDWALGQLSLDQRVGRFEISDAEVPLQCVYRQIDLQHYRFEASEVCKRPA